MAIRVVTPSLAWNLGKSEKGATISAKVPLNSKTLETYEQQTEAAVEDVPKVAESSSTV